MVIRIVVIVRNDPVAALVRFDGRLLVVAGRTAGHVVAVAGVASARAGQLLLLLMMDIVDGLRSQRRRWRWMMTGCTNGGFHFAWTRSGRRSRKVNARHLQRHPIRTHVPKTQKIKKRRTKSKGHNAIDETKRRRKKKGEGNAPLKFPIQKREKKKSVLSSSFLAAECG